MNLAKLPKTRHQRTFLIVGVVKVVEKIEEEQGGWGEAIVGTPEVDNKSV